MLISYNWLQEYFADPLPAPAALAELLTFHAFEVEELRAVGDDTVFDIDVLPNRRFDCLAHRGIAKEVSVITGTPLAHDPLRETPDLTPTTDTISISIDEHTQCRRYAAARITGISVGESPEWLKQKLEAIGQKSINNVVDATNYVMFNLGQPLHAFDAQAIGTQNGAHRIRVRTARDGEEITTLGGDGHTLSESDLLITDGVSDTPIGIAGIKGGTAAEVTEQTTDIILESANFNGATIRKTSTRLGLRTDASARFEGGLSSEFAGYGLVAAVELVRDIAGGELRGFSDTYPKQAQPYKLGVSRSEINRLLGTNISDDAMADILVRFGFLYETIDPQTKVIETAESLVGTPYVYGASVSYDAPERFDCSSFVVYTFAHAGISIPRMAVDQFVFGVPVDETELKQGDVIFSSFQREPSPHTFTRLADHETVTHVGPQLSTQEFMPGTEVPERVSHNGIYLGNGKVIHACKEHGVVIESINESAYFKTIAGYRRMTTTGEQRYVVTVPFERLDLRITEDLIEEIGRIYGYANVTAAPLPKLPTEPTANADAALFDRVRDTLIRGGCSEVYTYALQDAGEVRIHNPLSVDKAYMRPTLVPGIRDALVRNLHNREVLGVEDIHLFEIGTVFADLETEYTTLAIGVARSGKKASVSDALDSIAAHISDALGIDIATYEIARNSDERIDSATTQGALGIAEYSLTDLAAALPDTETYTPQTHVRTDSTYTPISPYPFATRDIAVWMPADTASDELLEYIKDAAGELFAQARLFDTYEKDDRISYAFRIAFQSDEKTLTDEEVNTIMKKIQETISKKHGWEIR